MRYFNKAMLVASAALCKNLSVFSQNITLKTGNVTVKEAMEQLKKSSGYSFVFSSVDVNTQKRVSVSVQNASIEEAVKQILAGQQGLNYEVKGKKIIVQKKAQSSNVRKISGRVVDANNEPVIGASIQVEGTGIGTISDFDGNFTLEAAEGNTLVFSFIGYKKQYIEVKRQKSLSVVMREDSEMLDDVVVIGYGTVSKKELTSAVSHISSKDLLQIGSGNPAMQMQGKVSGLAVENSTPSDPNSSPSIQVRGVSSRSAGLGPLIVIDGVPGGSLDNVNENDIESIDVLKDGAASAIYGTRGSNGVIVITTKKGSTDGQIHTAYSGFVNITTPIRELNVLSADEFRKYNRGEDYGANTDWFDELTKVAVSHSHTLQVMGGNSKNNYKATVDYKNTEGIDLRSGREQLGARLSLNHTGKNDLYNVVLNVAPRVINYQDSDYDTFRSALMINPTTPVMDPNNPGYYTKITTYSTNNPVEVLKLEQSGGEQTILSWDGTFKLNLLPLFSTNKNHYLSTQITLAQQIIETDYSWFRPSTSTIEQDNGFSGEASRKYDKNKQESLEWLVNYGYDTNNHHLKFMGGYSYQYFVNDGLNAENKNFASDILGPNNLGSGTYNSDEIGRLGMGSYKNDAKLIAFFGRLSYNYKDKYFATFSLRHEGSSKFGANHKWGSFPAVSAGWRISQEEFMKNISWINNLKIRASWGTLGNINNVGNYDYFQNYNLGSDYNFNDEAVKGILESKPANLGLGWETVALTDFGVDIDLFDNKLSIVADYYIKNTSDILLGYNVPVETGIWSAPSQNIGKVKNTGFEMALTYRGNVGDLKYTVTGNIATNKNKVVDLAGSDDIISNGGDKIRFILREGEPIGSFYGYKTDGLYTQEEIDAGRFYTFGRIPNAGDIKYVPQREDVKYYGDLEANEDKSHAAISGEDRTIIGKDVPDFTYGVNLNLQWKNFELSVFGQGVSGTMTAFESEQISAFMLNANPREFHRGRWTQENPNPRAIYPRIYGGHSLDDYNQYFSDYQLFDSDYFRIKSISLGYMVPINVVKSWGLSSLKLFVTG